MKIIQLITPLLLLFPGLSQGAVLFTEDFSSATIGQTWNGYNGWTGTDLPIIEAGNGGKVGTFVGSPNTTGVLYKVFGETYDLETQGYRLAFDFRGYISRQFEVVLRDVNANRLGLQISNSINERAISALSIINGVSTLYTDGGFNGGTTSWPTGFNSETFYQVYIDVNGTSASMEIGGLELAAGKARVIYNAAGGTMQTYTMEFDLPAGFGDLGGVLIAKDTNSTNPISMGNFQLVSVPEPSTVMACLMASAVLSGLGALRRMKHTEESLLGRKA